MRIRTVMMAGVLAAVAFFPLAGVALADGQAGCSGSRTAPSSGSGNPNSVCVVVGRDGQAANGADGTRGADGANGVDGVHGRVN